LSKVNEKIAQLSQELLTLEDDNLLAKEMSKLIDFNNEKIDEYCEFSRGKSDQQSWIEANRLIFGKPFSYSHAEVQMLLGNEDKENLKINKAGFLERAPRAYLSQYIADDVRDKSTLKCRQSEFSETEINSNIYLCSVRPYTNVSHIFPTAKMANQIAKEKISVAIEKSPKIFRNIVRPYNLTSKAFSNNSFYTVDSSWTDHQGRGPSKDKITFDEYESQNPHIEDIYSESTSHSALGIKVRISTPKFPNAGIDAQYQKGCQYKWVVTCPKCKETQMMSFPENVINYFELAGSGNTAEDPEYIKKLDQVYIGCKFCGCYLDRTTDHYIQTSRWVADKPHLIGMRHSYHVTYFMLPWKTGKEILYKYHTFKFYHQFQNEVLGCAYLNPESEINREIFEQCSDRSFKNAYQKVGLAKNISMGIDWGDPSWVVIRANGWPGDVKKPRIIYIEKINKATLKKHGYAGRSIDHVKRVEDIIKFFSPRIIINDANGLGVDRNAYLIRKFPTRCWGCFYDTDEVQKQRKKEKLLTPSWSEGRRTVTVSRLATFRLLIQEYEEKGVAIPKIDPEVESFIQHHANLVFERYVDENSEQEYEVVGHSGPDHYGHADNYAKIGFDKLCNVYRKTSAGIISPTQDPTQKIIQNVHPDLV
jgi:hypothetical protein